MSRHLIGPKSLDTGATLRALRRAAKRARELGARTGTPVYVIQDNSIVNLTKQNVVAVRRPPKQREAR